MNLLTTKVHDVVTAPERANILAKSKMSYLNLAAVGNRTTSKNTSQVISAIERDAFFIINNTNGQLYHELKDFGPKFSENQINQIDDQRTYLTALSLGVMGIIMLSAVVVIPLFGKV
jgi:hypothetical protein